MHLPIIMGVPMSVYYYHIFELQQMTSSQPNVAKLSLNLCNSGNLPEESRGVVPRVTWLNLVTSHCKGHSL